MVIQSIFTGHHSLNTKQTMRDAMLAHQTIHVLRQSLLSISLSSLQEHFSLSVQPPQQNAYTDCESGEEEEVVIEGDYLASVILIVVGGEDIVRWVGACSE